MKEDHDITYDWTIEEMARYPFLEDSKKYIKYEGPGLEELVRDRVWDMVRIRGKERILQAIESGEIKEVPMQEELDMEMELYSYPIGRILVSCIDDNYLTNRYALGESEKFLKNLEKESIDYILKVGTELGIDGKKSKENISLYFKDYLENTAQLKSIKWKLVNQDLRDGFIYLDRDTFLRILKENLFQRIANELPRPVTDDLVDLFSSQIEEISTLLEQKREDFAEVDFGVVDSDKFPPCIKKMMSMQEEGMNLSHEERFALTAFLHKVGLSQDEILSFFSGSPDFRKDLALYQIEHITGETSGTEYTNPGCDLMKTNGICYNPDNLCKADWMKHPLSYYSVKKKKDKEESDEE